MQEAGVGLAFESDISPRGNPIVGPLERCRHAMPPPPRRNRPHELDCLVIHCPELSGSGGFCNLISLGVIGIADKLTQRGYETEILNIGTERVQAKDFSLEAFLVSRPVSVVALSLQWHYQMRDAVSLAAIVKRVLPRTAVIAGGLAASLFADELLRRFKCIDAVVRGDAEEPMCAILDHVRTLPESLAAIDNVTWRSGDDVHSNPIRFVATARDLESIRYGNVHTIRHLGTYLRMPVRMPTYSWEFLNPYKTLYVAAGRGCSVDCSYCGGGRTALRRASHRTAPLYLSHRNVISTFLAGRDLGIERYYLSFDPCPDDDYYPKLFRQLRALSVSGGLVFESWGLPDRALIDAFAETFGEHPLSRIVVSPETGSESGRRRNKGHQFTNADLLERASYMAAKRLNVEFFFGYPLARAEEHDSARTLALIRRLRLIDGSRLSSRVVRMEHDPGSLWDSGACSCAPPFRWSLDQAMRLPTERERYYQDVMGQYCDLERLRLSDERLETAAGLFRARRYEDAAGILRELLADRVDSAIVYAMLGLCSEALGDQDTAASYFGRVRAD